MRLNKTILTALQIAPPTPSLLPSRLPRPQCEQTTKGTGCTTVGVCGKTPETAMLQVRARVVWLKLQAVDGGG